MDCRGLGCPDQQDWFVAPCSHTRDSDHLEESNWEQQLRALAECDPNGNDHAVARFGHWGPGWVEIVLLRPDTAAARAGEELREQLAGYPVLDEEDFSRREWDAYTAYWDDGDATRDFTHWLGRDFPGYHNCREAVGEADYQLLREWFEGRIPSGDYYDPESGCAPRIRMVVGELTRGELAALVRLIRKNRPSS